MRETSSTRDPVCFLSHTAPVRTGLPPHLVCRYAPFPLTLKICQATSSYDPALILCTRSSSFFLGSLTALLGWNRVSRSALTNSAWEIKFFRTFMSENVFILCSVDILADNAFWARNNSAAEFWVLLPLSFSFQWCRWEVRNNPEAWFLGWHLVFPFLKLIESSYFEILVWYPLIWITMISDAGYQVGPFSQNSCSSILGKFSETIFGCFLPLCLSFSVFFCEKFIQLYQHF